jgi:hypothetical protein
MGSAIEMALECRINWNQWGQTRLIQCNQKNRGINKNQWSLTPLISTYLFLMPTDYIKEGD